MPKSLRLAAVLLAASGSPVRAEAPSSSFDHLSTRQFHRKVPPTNNSSTLILPPSTLAEPVVTSSSSLTLAPLTPAATVNASPSSSSPAPHDRSLFAAALSITPDIWGVVLGVFGILIGIPAFIFALPQIKGSMRAALWSRKRIAVFGPTGAGKTTFVKYLKGETAPATHIRTIGAQVHGKIALDLKGDKALYFAAKEVIDVGGEFRQQWVAVVRHYNPHGLVYVVDTTHTDIEVRGLEHLFETYKKWTEETLNKDILLRTILIFVNKSDVWGGSIGEERIKLDQYKKRMHVLQGQFDSLLGVNIMFATTSFTHASYYLALNQSLREFSTFIQASRAIVQ